MAGLRLRSFEATAAASAARSLGLRLISTTCRAVVVPRFGGPDVLELRSDVEIPDLKPHEVLVRTRSVSVNPLDTREASAIPFAALTAWRALHSTARIAHGQRLLVIGGGGAVGLAAIQLAVDKGCIVSTTCGSESVSRLEAAGVEQAVDYKAEDVEFALKGPFDAVLDTIGVQETERIGINLLKKGGHYMTLQGEMAALADKFGLAVGIPIATAILLKKQLQYRYSPGIGMKFSKTTAFSRQLLHNVRSILHGKYSWTYMRADSEGLQEIRRLAEAGKLKIPVQKTFPLAQAREAHLAKDKRLIPGKVVLEID